ncbi:MAG: fibronectin type III domain-containing protein, partial [Acidimicrobiaceae bacterium]|nr:fibronectin type III domain-containing protein [Acidimicrobiaceae bacterium]
TSHLITGLSTTTAYDVQVRATNGVHSDWSAVAFGATAPVAPTFVVAAGNTKLTVSFDTAAIAGRGVVVPSARWRIKDTDANMGGNQAGGWLPTADGAGLTYIGSSFDIPGATCSGTGCDALVNGTVYEVEVSLAYVGYSSGWQTAGDGTPAAPAVPAALAGLMVVEGDGALSLSWTEPAGTVTGYDVHYTSALSTGNDAVANEDAASGSEPADAWVDAENTFTSAFFTVQSLDNGTTYRVRVRAKNSGGSGPWVFGSGEPEIVLQWLSNTATAQVTEGGNFDVEAHLSSTAGVTEAISAGVTYAAGASNPASLTDDLTTGYATTITSSANQLVVLTLPRPVDDAVNEQHETFTVTLNAGTGYTLGARDVLTVTIIDNDPPAAPSGLSLTAGDAKLTASWSKPAGPVTGYQVRHKEASASDQAASTPGDPSTGWVTSTPSGTGTTLEITGLTNGTDYHVQVRATDGQTQTGNGYGDWSASQTGTPTAATASGVWTATLTADQNGVFYGCDNSDAQQDDCSSSTVLTEDQFTHGSVTYEVNAIYW